MNEVAQRSSDEVRKLVSEQEWQVRCELAACHRLIAHYGWDELINTHISARVPGAPGHILINPFGLFFGEVRASTLVKIDLEGNVVLDVGHAINRAGYVTHSAIYEARPDVNAVLHMHTVAGIAVSVQKEGLLPISQHALIFYGCVGYHPFTALASDLNEKARMAASLADNDVLFLQNHGTVTCAPTAREAFVLAYFLERACQIQVAALAGGRELIYPPSDACVKMERHGRDYARHKPIWPGLLRMLDKQDPTYNT
jgi:ribulose-5-phosphate 4-epimerase/fuculose-1-phosphate aldolase